MSSTAIKTKRMTMPEIKDRAKALGITPGRMKKAELIHTIQQAEGNTPCYGWSNGQCDQSECCFIQDCLKVRL
jgi:hypothetical protein